MLVIRAGYLVTRLSTGTRASEAPSRESTVARAPGRSKR
jgi:hypothetical protein